MTEKSPSLCNTLQGQEAEQIISRLLTFLRLTLLSVHARNSYCSHQELSMEWYWYIRPSWI